MRRHIYLLHGHTNNVLLVTEVNVLKEKRYGLRAYDKRSEIGWRDMECFPEEMTLELRNETGVTSSDVHVVRFTLAHYREALAGVEDINNFKLFNWFR